MTRTRRTRPGAGRNRRQRRLRALGSRLDRLENDLETVLAGGPIPPGPTPRSARLAQFLVAAGVILVLTAMALAVF